MARPGEIVTKAELFATVWPDIAVSDAALTTCIQELRRALPEHFEHARDGRARHLVSRASCQDRPTAQRAWSGDEPPPAWATGLLGWSMVKSGDVAGGLTVATEGVASAKAIGSVVFHPHMLGLLAVAQMANGLTSEALRTLDEAIAISDRTGERFYLGEFHRLREDINPSIRLS